MMATATRRTWLAIAALAVLFAAALAFLYARSQGYDEAAYFANVARLRQLKQLDARWELDAMKSKIGINTDYDPLVDPLLDLRQLQAQLRGMAAERGAGAAAALTPRLDALDQAIEEKTRLVEHFKSHNSVLRNSLAFLPGAADDIRRSTGRPIAEDANRVLLAVLVYNQNGADEKAAEIEARLGQLATERRRLAAGGGSIDIFAAHVRAVLREHQAVNGLLQRIAAVPVAARIDDINQRLANEQLRAAAAARQYRHYLLLLSAGLAALLLYAAFCLAHSHALINRYNQQLQEANERLEQRVHQRTQELRVAQEELVATARQAGMAEIATNVLHNVGNVLNSVNVSAGVVGNLVYASKVEGLARAVHLLDEHAADLGDFLSHDEKGRLLPGYLAKLAEALAAEQQAILAELAQLTKSIEHIKDIVATQQSYAGATCLIEPTQVQELIEDALRMNAGALERHQVTVLKEFANLPPLPLDRHRLLQILINLIDNAKQAMGGSTDAHRLTLRVDMADTADGRQLRIGVADEGEGIAAENMTKIFSHGFTTRQDGHGFGLHSSALAAQEMGGSLSAHSDGPGRGACFTLLLPIERTELAG